MVDNSYIKQISSSEYVEATSDAKSIVFKDNRFKNFCKYPNLMDI